MTIHPKVLALTPCFYSNLKGKSTDFGRIQKPIKPVAMLRALTQNVPIGEGDGSAI